MHDSEMIVAIVALVCVFGFLKFAVRQKMALREKQMGVGKELDERLQRLEERMANLETIVLDREKHEEFDQALK